MHQRQIIREAVHAALLNNTSVGTKVSKNRQLTYREGQLPAIDLANNSDDVDPASADTAPLELFHTYSLDVRVRVAVTDEADNAMDALAEEIEPLMHADPFFGGAAGGNGSRLTGTTFNIGAEGELDIGLMVLKYDFQYYTDAQPVLSGMDDFNTAYATHKQGADQADADDAEDNIEVQS